MNTVTYGSRTISYSLRRAARKTLAITVKPDMSVTVTAPEAAEQESIERIIHKRSAWVIRQQRFFAQFMPRTPVRQYISGETHLYLGKQYRLRVRRADTEEVKLSGGYIYVSNCNESSPDRVRTLLYDWYSDHAQRRFDERLSFCMQKIAGWNIPAPRINIRMMARCWGTCSPDGKIALNLDLIRSPRACIDYVILHELCHIRHPNHTREFYKLLSSILPDWWQTKIRLERLLS